MDLMDLPMETQKTTAAGPSQTYILCGIAGTTYAVHSYKVRHLEMVEDITAVPNAPPSVDGVVFSRGQVVPVINLRVRFGFERAPRDLRTRLLVVEVGGRLVGLMVDEARDFVAIPDAAIHPPGQGIGGLSSNYLEGVSTIGDRIVLILNINDMVEAVPTAAA